MISPDDAANLPVLAEYPFQHNFYRRTDGLALHYLDEGQGPPVVMVHGNPSWSFYYRRLIHDLSTDFRCLAPDHMGMGFSSRPGADQYGFTLADRVEDMAALMDHWRINEPAHFIVHDWGGPIGLSWAVNNPELVASITIINSGLRVPKGYRLPVKLTLFKMFNPLGKFLAQDLNLFVEGTATFGATGELSSEARRGLTAPYADKDDRLAVARFVQDIPLSAGHPSYALLDDINRKFDALSHKPSALVWGLCDFVFNRDVFFDWHLRLPEAETLVLPQAGHYVLEDEPERVSSFVGKFLRTCA